MNTHVVLSRRPRIYQEYFLNYVSVIIIIIIVIVINTNCLSSLTVCLESLM